MQRNKNKEINLHNNIKKEYQIEEHVPTYTACLFLPAVTYAEKSEAPPFKSGPSYNAQIHLTAALSINCLLTFYWIRHQKRIIKRYVMLEHKKSTRHV